jgi:hypothetical protein
MGWIGHNLLHFPELEILTLRSGGASSTLHLLLRYEQSFAMVEGAQEMVPYSPSGVLLKSAAAAAVGSAAISTARSNLEIGRNLEVGLVRGRPASEFKL